MEDYDPTQTVDEADLEAIRVFAERLAMPTGDSIAAQFDNRPTWDNWPNSTPTPFDNRPTWDNWSNR